MTTVLHTRIYGDPQKPPMVMLHGFMGQGKSFAPLIHKLSKYFRILTVDLPGHGKSLFSSMPEARRPANFSQVASMVLEDVDRMGMANFILYGYSMGGRVAQEVCLQAPERIEHLFLESAGFGMRDMQEREARYAKDLSLLKHVENKEEFKRFLFTWHRLPLFCTLTTSPLLPGLIATKMENKVEELRQSLQVMSVGVHSWYGDKLAALDVPVTYFYGEKDIKYTSEAREGKKAVPRMKVIPFSQASHNVHIQFSKEIAREVKRALGSPTGQGLP